MGPISGEAIEILKFLLPGFVAAAVLYSLTSHPKPSAFERAVQALIFTIVIQVIVAALFWIVAEVTDIESWVKTWEVIVSVVVAVAFGLMAVYASNNDVLYRPLRRFGITRENSYPSEWYSAFSHHSNCYVVLHLTGERRLYGWPTEWPSRPDEGHFLIEEGEWITDEGESTPLEEVAAVLVPGSEVEMIEFLEAVHSKESTE